MAFQLKKNAVGDFEGVVGKTVIVASSPSSTALANADYNDADITPVDSIKPFVFVIVEGAQTLNGNVSPPVPPEEWQLIEIDASDASKTQILERKFAGEVTVVINIIGKPSA